MRVYHILAVLLVCMIPLLSFGQDQAFVDSLLIEAESSDPQTKLNAYIELYLEFQGRDVQKVRTYAYKAVQTGQDSGDKNLIAGSLNLLGVFYSSISEQDSALIFFEKVRKMYEELGNEERVSAVLNNTASIYTDKGQYEKSLELNLESLRLKEKLGVTGDDLASSYWNIGNVSSYLKDFKKSNAWYRKGIAIYQDIKDEQYEMILHGLIAQNLEHLDSIPEAVRIYEKQEKHYRETNDINELASVLDHLGQNAMREDDYEKAEAYFVESLSLAVKGGEKSFPGYLYRRLSKLYLKTNKLTKAKEYALLSIENSKQYNKAKRIINDYKILSQIESKMGKHRAALENYKLHHSMSDSIFGLEKMNAIRKLEIEYETKKKQQQIILLEEKNKTAALQRKSLLGGLLGLVVLSISVFYGLLQRMKKNKLAKLKVDQELNFKNNKLESSKRELTAYALQIADKNRVLNDIKDDVATLKTSNERSLQRIVNKIDLNQNNDDSWKEFKDRFESIHIDFDKKVKTAYPTLTSNDIRFISLLKMSLSNKEIANILNISPDGIKKARYRLRKKLNISTSDSLEDLVMGLGRG